MPYILWRVCCLPPLIIIITPSFNVALHQAPDGSGCVRGGALKQPGLAVCDEAHLTWMKPHHRLCYIPSAPLLGRPGSFPCMHAGVLVGPGRERRGRPRRQSSRTRCPDEIHTRVIRPSSQDAGPTSPVERRGPRGRRSQHDEGTRPPCLFWTLFPLDTFILLFFVK